MPRLLYVVTHAMTARHLLRGQLAWMQARGFEVAIAASPGADLDVVAEREGVQVFPVPIPREIDPLADLRAVAALRRVMADWRPDIVNAGTPKAGLLGMMAARAARVPVRIYTLRGLRLETTEGLTRTILRTTERVASACAHEVVAVSRSLADRYVALGLAPKRKGARARGRRLERGRCRALRGARPGRCCGPARTARSARLACPSSAS